MWSQFPPTILSACACCYARGHLIVMLSDRKIPVILTGGGSYVIEMDKNSNSDQTH